MLVCSVFTARYSRVVVYCCAEIVHTNPHTCNVCTKSACASTDDDLTSISQSSWMCVCVCLMWACVCLTKYNNVFFPITDECASHDGVIGCEYRLTGRSGSLMVYGKIVRIHIYVTCTFTSLLIQVREAPAQKLAHIKPPIRYRYCWLVGWLLLLMVVVVWPPQIEVSQPVG